MTQKNFLTQILRYGIVASFGLVIDFGTLVLLTEMFGLYYLIGVSGGFISGLVVTYSLSNKYVFGTPKANHKKIFLLFGVIGLVGLGLLNLLVWILTDLAGINYILSKALATIAIFMWNFIARKTLYHDKTVSELL